MTDPMTDPILDIRNLHISFFTHGGEIPAVMDFSCEVMPGEAMGLVGESGCGKSTVALGIMQDLGVNGRITEGEIIFNGRNLNELSDDELRQIRGSEIAMVYQEPMASLNPAMRVGRQLIEVPLTHQAISKAEARKLALDMLEAVRLPDPERIMRAFPHQISGGQQQRIVIAMALLSKPKLLLMDEPTTALDVTVEAGIVELVKDLCSEFNTSMLFISHNLGLVLETCDKLTVMYSGEAVESGSIETVFGAMRHPYTRALCSSIPLPGTDKNAHPLEAIPGQLPLPHERPDGCNFGPRCEFFEPGLCDQDKIDMQEVEGGDGSHASRCLRIADIAWGGERTAQRQFEPIPPGATVLNIEDAKKYYRVGGNEIFGTRELATVKANEQISIDVREGETLALVGESGCGKSTIARILLGLETLTEGKIVLDDVDCGSVGIEKRSTDTIKTVQMVFQNPFDTLNPSHSVGGQIMRTLEKFGVGETDKERHQKMLELLDLVKLPRAFAERMPRQLSGGQKQRIGIARAFAGAPKIVIADEPVSALDVSVQAAVTDLLNDIQRNSRTAMLFISHDLSIVRYLADRIAVMYLGYIVEYGETEEVFSPPYHPYTEALLSAVPIADVNVQKKRILLEGDVPSALNPPPGCPFQTRCHRKVEVEGNRCETETPELRDLGNGHQIRCHLADSVLNSMEPVISMGKTNQKGKKQGEKKPAPN